MKNVHLAPAWLVTLEKKLHTLVPHDQFRLFLTAEIHPKLPASLLRMSQTFLSEAPPGIKANLQHTLQSLPASRFEKAPAERGRLYFLLAWLHAMIQVSVEILIFSFHFYSNLTFWFSILYSHFLLSFFAFSFRNV